MDARDAIELVCEDPGRTGLLSDFDGTISPIVEDPAGALPLPGAVEVLKSLSERLAVVAVVSGRPLSFLADSLCLGPSDALEAFGLYGIEHLARGVVTVAPAALAFAPSVRRARELLVELPEGVEVEDKTYSVTIHWRRALDPARAGREMRSLGGRVAELTGLSARVGRRAIELIAPVGIDKGRVTAEIAEAIGGRGLGAPRVAFVGDDTGDVAAFRALERAEGVEALKVAVGSREAPEELISSADLVLADPAGAVGFLQALDARLRGQAVG